MHAIETIIPAFYGVDINDLIRVADMVEEFMMEHPLLLLLLLLLLVDMEMFMWRRQILEQLRDASAQGTGSMNTTEQAPPSQNRRRRLKGKQTVQVPRGLRQVRRHGRTK